MAKNRSTPRMLRCSTVGTLACLLSAAALTGCTPGASPAPTPTSTPTSTAIFASEDEALAAATDVYQEYLAVSDQVSSDGGTDPERLRPFLADAYWLTEEASIEQLRAAGVHTDGNSSFDSAELVEISDDMNVVTVRLCADVSNIRIVDSSGEDITPSDRTDRIPLEVEFAVDMADTRSLLIARSDVWAATDGC
jgi:hypothetical protein